MLIWLAVAGGGAVGSALRHGVNMFFTRAIGRPVPYATASVNVLGGALIGALAGALAVGTIRMSPLMRAFVFVGVLGGFTTFSSLALDTVTLTIEGRAGAAALNVAAQLALGVGAAFVAYSVAVNA